MAAFWTVLWGGAIEAFSAGTQAIAVALISLAIVLSAASFLVGAAPEAKATDKTPQPAIFPRVPVLCLLGAMALFCMVPEGAVLDWGLLYVHQELGAGLTAAGLAFGFFSGAMARMRFLGDAVRNRYGAVLTLRISGLIGAVGLIAGAVAPNDVVAIAGLGFAGLGVANMVPIMFSAAGN